MSQKTQSAESFKENYAKLQQIAQKLSHTEEVDIDELVPLVDEATRAYQLCKSRIEAVESALTNDWKPRAITKKKRSDASNESP